METCELNRHCLQNNAGHIIKQQLKKMMPSNWLTI